MNETLLSNWKGANLEGLRRRAKEISKRLDDLKFEEHLLIDEKEVISYYIALREGDESRGRKK